MVSSKLRAAALSRILLGTSAIGATMLCHGQVLAQETPPPPLPPTETAAAPAVPAAPAEGLGEIVVTASKRAENLQRAALSVTAVGGEALATRNIVDASQLTGLAPAVQIQPSFILLTFIRGVGNYSSQPAVDQSIAYNVDGIYLDRPYAVPNQLFDMERIELLRGPQGTLQGRNSTGGSVNFITARPVMDFEGKAQGSFGNYSAITTEGMVNVKLADQVALRVSAASSDHDGYFKNGFGDGNTQGVRARLLARPSTDLEILLTAEYSRRNEKGPTVSNCPPGSTDVACQGVPWRPFSGAPGQGTDPVLSMDEENFLKSKNIAVYGEISYDLGFGSVTWVPNYRYHTYANNLSYSNAFGYYPAVKDGLHSQELRIASNPGSDIVWVAGVYYGRQKSREQNYFLTGAGPSITVDRPGFRTIGNVYFRNDVDSYVYRSISGFGQVSVPLADTFRIVAGGRYTKDRKTLIGNTGVVTGATPAGVPIEQSADVSGRQSSGQFTYKAGFEFDAADRVLTYANVSTGFKAGGANGVPAGSGLPTTFGPEKNTAYQAGVKSRFLDNRVQLNAEAFYYDYRGYQTSLFGVTPQGVLVGLNTNSQKARMYGGEAEASILATPADRFDLSVAVLSAKYKEFFIPSNGLDLSGKRMQNAPKFTFTGNYSHTFDLVGGATIVAHGETRYESGQWVDYRLSPGSYVSGFWRHSADVTYNAPQDRWSVGAFIRNISNNGSPIVAVSGLGPFEVAQPLPPRTYGVRATTRF